jgi:signal transduction histidine kinase
MFFLFSAISLWRIPNMLITPIGEVGFLDFNAGYMIFLWGIINSIVTTIGLIILASEKLQQQLRVKFEQVSYARDIAHRSLQEQQHFMAMLSHEFKAPIGAIKANADAALLLATPQTGFVEESLSRIKNVSERLNSLVERCLDDEWMAHSIENNQVSLEPVSLTQILRNLSDEFNVTFHSTVSTDAVVKGESIFLPVLFANLIANALRHARNIESVQVSLLEQGNDYLVQVMDDGEGIDEQQRHYIFDKYYRADNGHSTGGSGLGLFFVKKITEMHEGEVTVNCDGLTTFTVRLTKTERNNG